MPPPVVAEWVGEMLQFVMDGAPPFSAAMAQP
jgi:hypothetical protein